MSGYADTAPIVVSDHAARRFARRFCEGEIGKRTSECVREQVRLGLGAGRVSKTPPPGWIGSDPGRSLFVWSEDGEMIFAVEPHNDSDQAWVVTTVVRAFVNDRPSLEPAAEVPVEPRLETSLADDLSKLTLKLGPDPLHLPSVYGRHVARISKAKGKWTVTCVCGTFRVQGDESRRHFIEQAWGLHRNEIGGS